jgi:hypothetical protein
MSLLDEIEDALWQALEAGADVNGKTAYLSKDEMREVQQNISKKTKDFRPFEATQVTINLGSNGLFHLRLENEQKNTIH